MYQTKFDSINAELPVRKSRPRHLSTISANYSLFCLLFSIKDSRLFTHTVGYVQLFDVTSGHIMRYSDRLVWLVNDYYTTNEFAGLALEDEVEYMDTSETPWYWYYKARCGVWHRVEDDPKNFMSSNDLERYYLRNPKGVINMTSAGVQFQINFAESTQFNVKTGKIKQIKRSFQTDIGFRCKCDDISPSPPAHWENVDPKKPYQLISLRKDCREYQEMERFVRDVGLLHDSIVSINRIQNMDLWELFCRKKIQLMRIKGQSDIEEQMLFHGTSAKNVHSICTFNFSCRLSDKRRKGHVLGKGTYFAKHASFATKYSENTCQGTKVMLLARVIVGKYRRGHQDYCTPNDDQNDNIHDSCVDNALCPRIFVIFDSNQIYPEYVLEYRCS